MIYAKTEFVNLFNNFPLDLEFGGKLFNIKTAYQTYGKLNSECSNVILVCHALTGNAHAAGILAEKESDPDNAFDLLSKYSEMSCGRPGWWDGIIGPGKALDTNKYFIVCPNILGSCYGTTGPASIDRETSKVYGSSFPVISIKDIVKVQRELFTSLGINRIYAAIGGSMGGMQVLEWSLLYPDFIECIIPVATAIKNTAWAIALNLAAKRAICQDPVFNNGNYTVQPEKGLELARIIAMISYRSDISYNAKFDRLFQNGLNYDSPEFNKKINDNSVFAIQSYLNYQGEKIVKRFDANSYLAITNAIDLFDLTRGRGDTRTVLSSIGTRTLCVGVSSDVLYPPSELRTTAQMIPGAIYKEITSPFGHDSFLIEFEQLNKMLTDFLI
jgi:homoserine O-acetyltransferase